MIKGRRLGIRPLAGWISVAFSDFSGGAKKAENQRLSKQYFDDFLRLLPQYNNT